MGSLKYKKLSLVLGTALVSAMLASPAIAQDEGAKSASSGSDASANGDIIVTARRTEERLQDVPISIAVVTPQQIADRNIVAGSDLAVYTPSLTVNQRYGPETSSFSIRGFTQEAGTAPSVGVYFAEVPTPRVMGGTNSGSNLAVGSFMDLENTQILKGPQGTLFGRNTTGGAILLVPQKPTDKFEGYVEGSAGNYGMLRGQAMVNIPLADTFKVRFDVDRMKRDGYMKNRSGIGPKDFNDTNYTYFRGSILADLTPDLQNYTVAYYSKSNTHGFSAHMVYCNPALTAGSALAGIAPMACAQFAKEQAANYGPYDVENSVADPYFKIKQWQIINNTTWTVNDNLTIKNIASYSEYQADLAFNLNGENFTYDAPGAFSTTNLGPAPDGHNTNQAAWTEELQLQGKAFNNRLTWQVGGYMERSYSPGFNTGYAQVLANCPGDNGLATHTCSDPLRIAFPFPPYGTFYFPLGNVSNFRTKSIFNDKALYAQATMAITDQLNLTGGIRYTWDDNRFIGENTRYYFPTDYLGNPVVSSGVRRCTDFLRFPDPYSPGNGMVVTNPAQCHNEFRVKSSKPTWLIDVDYKPTNNIMLYAKYARGYRAGGAAVDNIGSETWQPEKLDTYEVGTKLSWGGPVRGYFDASLFYNDFSNQQVVATIYDPVGTPKGPGIVNAGSSTIKGAEIDAGITPFDGMKLSVSYAYLDTKIKKLSTVISTSGYTLKPLAQEGDPLALVPKNRVTATAAYTLPLDNSFGAFTISATYVHTDKQLITRNTLPQYQFLPATDLLNLNVTWKNVMNSPVDAAFFMTNVTNKVVPVVVSSTAYAYGYESMQYGQPRMWGFRLRYSFGQ